MTSRILRPTRRGVLQGLGASAIASGLATPALASGRPIKIGFVTPQTGPLAIFAEPDDFVLNQFRSQLADGLMINGTKHPVEFIVKDSQSSSRSSFLRMRSISSPPLRRPTPPTLSQTRRS